MNRLIGAAALLSSLVLVPGLASAQGAQQGGMQGGMQSGQSSGAEFGRTTSIVAVVKGTVTNLNLSRGSITVSTGGSNVTLNALPSQIADLNPGDLVALSYYNYAGARWLTLNQGMGGSGQGGSGQGAGVTSENFSQYGSVTGYVSQLNKSNGAITVRNIQFRTHPQFLDNLLPGQFVTVNFAQIGGVNWAQGISPAGGGSAGSSTSGLGGSSSQESGASQGGSGSEGGSQSQQQQESGSQQ